MKKKEKPSRKDAAIVLATALILIFIAVTLSNLFQLPMGYVIVIEYIVAVVISVICFLIHRFA